MRIVKTPLQIVAWLLRFFAWCFAVGTATVLGILWFRLAFVPRPDRHSTMMSNGPTDAWGLTYVGRQGVVLALVELVFLVGASGCRGPGAWLIGSSAI